jgi:hypothetical protein
MLTVKHPGAPLFLMLHMLEVFNHSAVLRNVLQVLTLYIQYVFCFALLVQKYKC